MGLQREIKWRQLCNEHVYKLSHSSTELKSTVKMSGSLKILPYVQQAKPSLYRGETRQDFLFLFGWDLIRCDLMNMEAWGPHVEASLWEHTLYIRMPDGVNPIIKTFESEVPY